MYKITRKIVEFNGKEFLMKTFFKRFWVFIPLILAVLMYFVLPHFPAVTEYVFSRGLFKIITVPLGFLVSLVPISLTEWIVILAAPAVITLLVILIVKLVRRKGGRKKLLLKAGKFTVGVISCLAFMYMACHGANYYRYPMEKLMDLDTSQKTPEALYNACVWLAKGAAEARADLGIPEDEPFTFSESIYTELSRANSGYKAIVEEYPFLWSSSLRQKPVILSEPWSYTGITGVYCPFIVESNVNTAQPDYGIPMTAAHESAHLRGVAKEDECNFLAFLSCINSEYPEYRYSGYMEAFVYCSSALYAYDEDMWLGTQQYITEGMYRDFAAMNKYSDDHKGKVEEVSSDFNDNFIKAQGVSDGVLSYDRVTELILAYLEKIEE